MSTSAAIVIHQTNGLARAIYCHGGGFPEDLGRCLQAHYQTAEKVKALIALGGVSYVGERVAPAEGERHSFQTPAEGVTVAYIRDRGDSPTHRASRCYGSLEEALGDWVGGVSYAYVFEERSGQWLGNDGPTLHRDLAHGRAPTLLPLAGKAGEMSCK